MSATPRPWKLRHDSYGDEIWYGGNECGMYQIVGPESCYLAACDNEDDETRAMCRADAELIVRAVNTHNVLVEACRGLVTAIMDEKGGSDLLPVEAEWDPEHYRLIEAARAALAQAEAAP